MELSPGGIAKELNSTDAAEFLATLTPTDPVAQLRAELLAELAADIAGIEAQIKQSRRRIRDAMTASGTTLTDIFGVGPIIAAMLIGNSGSMSRFADRDRYAAYNGARHRPGRVLLRRPHSAPRVLTRQPHPQPRLHLAALIQLRQRHSEGRAYYDRRVAEGKTGKEAIRALK